MIVILTAATPDQYASTLGWGATEVEAILGEQGKPRGA